MADIKEIYHNDFSKGLNTKITPHLLPDGASPEVVNFDLTESVGTLTKRKGQATYVSTVGSGSTLCGLGEFIDSAGALHLVAAVNDYVYEVTAPSTWTQIFTSASMNGAETNFAQMDNLYVIVNKNITTQKWSGSGATSNLGGSPPANVKYILTHGDRLWMLNSSAGKSRAHYSAIGDPEDWTSSGDSGAGFIDIATDDGDEITGAASVGGALIVFKKSKTFYIHGYKPSNFFLRQVSAAIGCVANRTIAATDNQVIWLSTEGVYITNPNIYPVPASDNIKPSIDALSDTVKVAAAAGRLRNQYWLAYDSDANSQNDTAYVLDYLDGSWTQYSNIKASVFLTRRISGVGARAMRIAPMPQTDRVVGEYLLTVEGVTAKVSMCKTKLMDMVKAGEFPQPKVIGKVNFWRGADVDSWIRETFATVGPSVVQLRAVQ